jgi:hypothetical protein
MEEDSPLCLFPGSGFSRFDSFSGDNILEHVITALSGTSRAPP